MTERACSFIRPRPTRGAEYSVSTLGPAVDGAERADDGLSEKRVSRVTERVEFPSAVRQNELDYVHWTDNVGTVEYPAMSSVPSVPYNFRLLPPPAAARIR